jgi:hypothetical protein
MRPVIFITEASNMNRVVPLKMSVKDVKAREEKEEKTFAKKSEELKMSSADSDKSLKKNSGESTRPHAVFLSSEHQKSISIKISEFLHPNAPDISLSSERLIEPAKLKPEGGTVNPSFSIENASDSSSSPQNSANVFTFEESEIEEFDKARKGVVKVQDWEGRPSEEGGKGDRIISVQPAKTVLTPGSKNSEGGGQLHVPRLSGKY